MRTPLEPGDMCMSPDGLWMVLCLGTKKFRQRVSDAQRERVKHKWKYVYTLLRYDLRFGDKKAPYIETITRESGAFKSWVSVSDT